MLKGGCGMHLDYTVESQDTLNLSWCASSWFDLLFCFSLAWYKFCPFRFWSCEIQVLSVCFCPFRFRSCEIQVLSVCFCPFLFRSCEVQVLSICFGLVRYKFCSFLFRSCEVQVLSWMLFAETTTKLAIYNQQWKRNSHKHSKAVVVLGTFRSWHGGPRTL